MNKTKIVLRKIFTQRNPHTTMKHTTYLELGQKKKLYTILYFQGRSWGGGGPGVPVTPPLGRPSFEQTT